MGTGHRWYHRTPEYFPDRSYGLSRSGHLCQWWRVVNVAGRLVPGAEREQAALLAEEDVIVRDGHVRRAPHGRFGD